MLEQLAELSPVVQALPPSAAPVELKGALRYHGVDGRRLGEVLRVRTICLKLGVDVRVVIGPSITVAATASGRIAEPGGVLAVGPGQAADWLGPLPVEALHGIGPRQAQTLRDHGVHCVARRDPARHRAAPPGRPGRTPGGRPGPRPTPAPSPRAPCPSPRA
ncbi:hypothetical protein HEP87_59235 [Streptomyces sp. S1D4-11]